MEEELRRVQPIRSLSYEASPNRTPVKTSRWRVSKLSLKVLVPKFGCCSPIWENRNVLPNTSWMALCAERLVSSRSHRACFVFCHHTLLGYGSYGRREESTKGVAASSMISDSQPRSVVQGTQRRKNACHSSARITTKLLILSISNPYGTCHNPSRRCPIDEFLFA